MNRHQFKIKEISFIKKSFECEDCDRDFCELVHHEEYYDYEGLSQEYNSEIERYIYSEINRIFESEIVLSREKSLKILQDSEYRKRFLAIL